MYHVVAPEILGPHPLISGFPIVISFAVVCGVSFGFFFVGRVKKGALTEEPRIARPALVNLIMYLCLVLLIDLIGLLAAYGTGDLQRVLVLQPLLLLLLTERSKLLEILGVVKVFLKEWPLLFLLRPLLLLLFCQAALFWL